MTQTTTTVRTLPHSGMRTTADQCPRIVKLKSLNTRSGVALTAEVKAPGRASRRTLGHLQHYGRGGELEFDAADMRGASEVDAFAATCIEADGTKPDLESVMHALLTEHEMDLHVRTTLRKNRVPLRWMSTEYGHIDATGAVARIPQEPRARARFAENHREADTFMQMWNGTAWEDVVPRPEPGASKPAPTPGAEELSGTLPGPATG